MRGVGVLRGVRERFRDDVVGSDLDPVGEPAIRTYVELDGTGERRASASTAGESPPSVRIAGWMPRDISRSSSTTLVNRSAKRPTSVLMSSRPAGTRASAERNPRASVTSCCCAPSWRSRSMAPTASSPAAITRAREAASSARIVAFETAVATSSVNRASRSSASGGNGSSSGVATLTLPRRCRRRRSGHRPTLGLPRRARWRQAQRRLK